MRFFAYMMIILGIIVFFNKEKLEEFFQEEEQVVSQKETIHHPSYFEVNKDSRPDKTHPVSEKKLMQLVRAQEKRRLKELDALTATRYKFPIHTVSQGETVESIARDYGILVGDVLRENKLKKNSVIYPGDELILMKRSLYQKYGGFASCYGDGDGFHGKPTSVGGVYDKNAMTAAHRTLPEGTIIKVTNLRNGKTVRVTLNDKGPYPVNSKMEFTRDLDLSVAAMKKIGGYDRGVIPVTFEIIDHERGVIDVMVEKLASK